MAAKRKPGPDGVVISTRALAEWGSAAAGWIRTQADHCLETVGEATRRASGSAKSALVGLVDLLPLKPDSPFSTRLLRHYVEATGEPYELGEIPEEWQVWIAGVTRARPGRHRSLNPYNSGLYDLRNSLGHFDVVITRQKDSKRTVYDIEDVYEFGYLRGDRNQRGRHGFPLGELGDSTRRMLEMMLPEAEYRNPGGFTEKWEMRSVGKETILYIPQEVLASEGRPFQVHGRFVR